VDTSNNITGKTSNPHNLTLSAGGSSGGEGVSLGFKASALGVGTDIGGSIRAPAAFNGVYGLRPSAGRLSLWGFKGAGFGQESCKPVIGPLTGSVEDIDLWMKSVLDQKPWIVDPDLVPLGWRPVEKPKTFTVGLLTDDGYVQRRISCPNTCHFIQSPYGSTLTVG
jgi:amidase